MNREQAKKVAPILAAFAEGKEIEYRSDFSSKWVKVGAFLVHQCLSESPDSYRVKPEPVYEYVVDCTQASEGYKPIRSSVYSCSATFASQTDADKWAHDRRQFGSVTVTKREIKE